MKAQCRKKLFRPYFLTQPSNTWNMLRDCQNQSLFHTIELRNTKERLICQSAKICSPAPDTPRDGPHLNAVGQMLSSRTMILTSFELLSRDGSTTTTMTTTMTTTTTTSTTTTISRHHHHPHHRQQQPATVRPVSIVNDE
ncbi:unnamed protein product [Ectocarpus sp. 12 AP-2014]